MCNTLHVLALLAVSVLLDETSSQVSKEFAICSGLQDNGASVGFALAGGIFLVLGNIGTQYALAYCGLSITEVVSSSITVVGGVRVHLCLLCVA